MASRMLLTDQITTATGQGVTLNPPNNFQLRKVHAKIAGTGAVAATIIVDGRSPDKPDWAPEFTISLSGTTTDAYRGTLTDNGAEYRGRITAISGTGATVNLWMEE